MYQINADGSIISNKTGKPIYEHINDKGYHFVSMVVDGRKKTMLKHKVIAQHHLPNPDNLPEINHEDGNKSNCSVDNLEWCTRQFNVDHAVRTGLHHSGCSQGLTTLVREDILGMRKLHEEGMDCAAIGRKYGRAQSVVWRICHYQTYKGVV